MGALVGETYVGVDLKYEPSVGYTYVDVSLTYGGGSVTHVSGSVTCRGCKGGLQAHSRYGRHVSWVFALCSVVLMCEGADEGVLGRGWVHLASL